MNPRLFFALILLFAPLLVQGGVIKGKVTDIKGEALPFATIFVEGTTIGTNANGDGLYELTVAQGQVKVVCQYIGFGQSVFTTSVTAGETINHNFKLSSQSMEMKEVVIKSNAEDPAYRIIRATIKRRQFHLDQVKSFQTAIYLKGVARTRSAPKKFMGQDISTGESGMDSNGKGVLYLVEEHADYYSYGGKEKTIIHSVRQSGSPNGLGFSQFPSVITFYENNVRIFAGKSRGFISPISDNAILYYKYKLLGSYEENGKYIDKIQVIPRRDFEPCFSGTIYISEGDYAIQSLDMMLLKKSGMDLMDTMKLSQIYVPKEKDVWVIKSQVMYFTLNMFGFDVTATGVTVYNDQRVNEPIADSIFADRVVSVYDKTANKKDSTYWQEARPIPLEADESKDFVVKDSIRRVDEDPVRIDSLRRRANKFKKIGFLTSGYTYNGKKYKSSFSTNSLLLGISETNIINYNLVEGFNVAPKVDYKYIADTGRTWFASAIARYGFSNRHFNAAGRLYYRKDDNSWRGRFWLAGVEGGKYVYQYNPANPVLQWFNTYATLLYRENDLKIHERWDGTAFIQKSYGNGFSWFAKASFQQRLPLSNVTSFNLAPYNSGGMYDNTPVDLASKATAWEKHNAALFFASVSYKPGFTYTQYPDFKVANGSSWPRLTLSYQKGLPGLLNSKVNFDKWRFDIQDAVNLRLLGSLSYHFAAGGFINADYVSIPDLMHLFGNRGIGYASPYLQSFQFAQYYKWSNTEKLYGEAHVEYHLNGLLSNKIPGFRKLNWYFLCGGNAFYSSNNFYYTEAFVGIDNIGYKLFRFLRVDFVQSWDSFKGNNSGIRFGLNTSAFTANSNNITRSEW